MQSIYMIPNHALGGFVPSGYYCDLIIAHLIKCYIISYEFLK